MRNEALFSSDKNFWETPQKLFDELDAEFHFTLDAAASDENHKCARYFTQSDDGLRQNWEGETVFIVADRNMRHVSASLVRELAAFGKDYSAYVPEAALEIVKRSF